MNGFLIANKPTGITSSNLVVFVRKRLPRGTAIGHGGTLDPEASGVLPLCIGSATRLFDYIIDKKKTYVAEVQLGTITDTQDATGSVLEERAVYATEEDLRAVLKEFVGEIEQIPPMYSALKIGGKKLCDLAREGIEVERKARLVHIYDIDIVQVDLPFVTMRVHCSKGTYIRTLCDDIGEMLGVGGLMKSLVRTRVSCFHIGQALTIAEVEEHRDNGTLDEIFLPVDGVFSEYPALHVAEMARKKLQNGNRLEISDLVDSDRAAVQLSEQETTEKMQKFRVYDASEKFYGIYGWDEERRDMKSIKMFM